MPHIPVFFSFSFWLVTVIALAVIIGARRFLRPEQTAPLFAITQLLVLYAGLGIPIFALGLLMTLLSLVYVGALFKRSAWGLFLGLLALLFGREFIFSQLPAGSGALLFLAVGFSYTCLRLMSFVVDHSAGKIEQPDFPTFISYAVFSPAFVAGPITRYNEFAADLREPAPLTLESSTEALRRIIYGLIKKLLFVPWLTRYALSPDLNVFGAMHPWLALYAYAALIYMDFSGYSDLAVGTGRLFGIRLPENFNWPYLKTNLIDFWNSWHISLSNWLRDYIFLPVGQAAFRLDSLRSHPLLIGTLGYLLTMLFCGAWHSVAVHFLVWGLYHGVGLSVCKAFKFWANRNAPASVRRFLASRAGDVVGVLLTFHFVAFGWIFFVLNMEQARYFIQQLWSFH